ncbi:MAG: SDR family oxidoreductase [Pseudomonadota bacterium]
MTTDHDFAGRIALVTGAASGIGAACAKALEARGCAKLLLVDVNAEGIEALDLGCEVVPVIGSVADEALWDALEPQLAGLDHAVVNAGIGSGGPIAELSLDEWRRVMDVNLDGAFLTLRTAMRAMTNGGPDKGGSEKGGSVVITSSSTAVKPVAGIGPYGVSKAAVSHMTRIAALEGAPHNIRINAIAPGGVDTAIWESSDDFRRSVEAQGREATMKAMASTTPLGRFASSEQIANDILYMLSDSGSNITGHVLVSDGGFTL